MKTGYLLVSPSMEISLFFESLEQMHKGIKNLIPSYKSHVHLMREGNNPYSEEMKSFDVGESEEEYANFVLSGLSGEKINQGKLTLFFNIFKVNEIDIKEGDALKNNGAFIAYHGEDLHSVSDVVSEAVNRHYDYKEKKKVPLSAVAPGSYIHFEEDGDDLLHCMHKHIVLGFSTEEGFDMMTSTLSNELKEKFSARVSRYTELREGTDPDMDKLSFAIPINVLPEASYEEVVEKLPSRILEDVEALVESIDNNTLESFLKSIFSDSDISKKTMLFGIEESFNIVDVLKGTDLMNFLEQHSINNMKESDVYDLFS